MGTLTATNFAIVLVISFALALLIGAGVAFYFLKVKKSNIVEEKHNYNNFNRVDSRSYLPFERIVSVKGILKDDFGIICMPHDTYLAVLDITGYNFASASYDEQHSTMVNSVGFINAIEKPVQFRQTVRSLDISYSINRHIEFSKDLERKFMSVRDEYKEAVNTLEKYLDTPVFDEIEKECAHLKSRMISLDWQLREANEILKYLKGIEAISAKSRKTNQLIIRYDFDPNGFSYELDEQEILIKAANELSSMASIYSNNLERCGCKCKLMQGKDLLDVVYSHYHPITSDNLRIEEVFNSSLNGLFVSSNDLLDLKRSEIQERRFKKQMLQWEKQRNKTITQKTKETEDYLSKLSSAIDQEVLRRENMSEEEYFEMMQNAEEYYEDSVLEEEVVEPVEGEFEEEQDAVFGNDLMDDTAQANGSEG